MSGGRMDWGLNKYLTTGVTTPHIVAIPQE